MQRMSEEITHKSFPLMTHASVQIQRKRFSFSSALLMSFSHVWIVLVHNPTNSSQQFSHVVFCWNFCTFKKKKKNLVSLSRAATLAIAPMTRMWVGATSSPEWTRVWLACVWERNAPSPSHHIWPMGRKAQVRHGALLLQHQQVLPSEAFSGSVLQLFFSFFSCQLMTFKVPKCNKECFKLYFGMMVVQDFRSFSKLLI